MSEPQGDKAPAVQNPVEREREGEAPATGTTTKPTATTTGTTNPVVVKKLKESINWGKVLSCLSLLELVRARHVSKKWRSRSLSTCKRYIHTLDLSQFWAQVGVRDTPGLIKFVTEFSNVHTVNLGYCQHMSDDICMKILAPIIKRGDGNLTSLNFFYCYRLTDKLFPKLLKLTPNLEELNLGRTILLTEQVVKLLSNLEHLKRLVLTYNTKLTDDVLMIFSNSFPALEFLDIQACTELDETLVREELSVERPELEILGPKLIRPPEDTTQST